MIDPVSMSRVPMTVASNSIPTKAAPAVKEATGSDFASTMTSMALDMAQSLERAEASAIAGVNGKMPVQKVVENVLHAEQSLQTVIAVRDKVVAAYLELSRMQI